MDGFKRFAGRMSVSYHHLPGNSCNDGCVKTIFKGRKKWQDVVMIWLSLTSVF